jgi:hypothetical protein
MSQGVVLVLWISLPGLGCAAAPRECTAKDEPKFVRVEIELFLEPEKEVVCGTFVDVAGVSESQGGKTPDAVILTNIEVVKINRPAKIAMLRVQKGEATKLQDARRHNLLYLIPSSPKRP